MKTIKLSNASRPLAEYARELNEDIVLLTDGNNRPVAAIVPLKAVDESLALRTHPEFLDLIARSRAELAAGQRISLYQMKRAVLTQRKANKRLERTARNRGRSSACR